MLACHYEDDKGEADYTFEKGASPDSYTSHKTKRIFLMMMNSITWCHFCRLEDWHMPASVQLLDPNASCSMLDIVKGGQETIETAIIERMGYRNVKKGQNIGEENAITAFNPHLLRLAKLSLSPLNSAPQNPQSSSSSLKSQLPGTLLCPLNLPAAVAAAAAPPPAANMS